MATLHAVQARIAPAAPRTRPAARPPDCAAAGSCPLDAPHDGRLGYLGALTCGLAARAHLCSSVEAAGLADAVPAPPRAAATSGRPLWLQRAAIAAAARAAPPPPPATAALLIAAITRGLAARAHLGSGVGAAGLANAQPAPPLPAATCARPLWLQRREAALAAAARGAALASPGPPVSPGPTLGRMRAPGVPAAALPRPSSRPPAPAAASAPLSVAQWRSALPERGAPLPPAPPSLPHPADALAGAPT